MTQSEPTQTAEEQKKKEQMMRCLLVVAGGIVLVGVFFMMSHGLKDVLMADAIPVEAVPQSDQ